MRAGDAERLHAEVASVLDWWTVAGVAHDVGEEPRDWLKPVTPAAAAPSDAREPDPAVVTAALPATLEAFLPYLAGDGDAALLGPPARRVAPSGDPAAGLMILIDLPEGEDADAGRFMSGPAGRLLDRMLAAIGRTRETVWLAPLLPARPAGARIDAAALPALVALARHHVTLVAPKTLLLMGECATRGLTGMTQPQARGAMHPIDFGGTTVSTVATFGPSVLLAAPAMKRGAWSDLQLLLEGEQA